jgi:hypothetical protein
MGLDMYLTAKRYVSQYDNQDQALSTELMRHFPELEDGMSVQEVTVRLGYWRKANHIHKWFVDNCQEGKDDCGDYWVSRDHLNELRALCQQVLDFRHLAVDNLPTVEGFFFGATDYDDYYFRDVENTVKIIDSALKILDAEKGWDIEYQSSW